MAFVKSRQLASKLPESCVPAVNRRLRKRMEEIWPSHHQHSRKRNKENTRAHGQARSAMLPEHYHPRNKILSHRTLEPAPRPRRAPCKVMDTTSCNPHPLARNHLTGNRDARTAARYFLPRPRSPKKRRYFASGEESHSDGGQLAGGGRRITRGQAGGQWAAEETTPRAWSLYPKAARRRLALLAR